MTTICEHCENIITKNNLTKHQKTETCIKIQKLLINANNKYNNKLLEIENINKELLIKLQVLTEENNKLRTEIKTFEKSNEGYLKLVEIVNNKPDVIKKDNIKDNTFQIDIIMNNKQFNKTKYKDVPEDIVKKDIQSLKLKDNYQLEYREEDGYINITNLCKAGGKQFKHWNSIDKTKRFLDVLSSTVGIPTNEIIKYESGAIHERSTWAHPQVSINIAQWISPEFDVLVSKWVYEIMITGKVDISDNKTTQELDHMNKENKLLKNRIKLLESKVLQKQPRQTFEENKNVVYIVTTEYKEAQGHYKIGKAQDLQKRLSTLNTSDKHEVIYSTSCKTKKKMDLLEQIVHDKLDDKRIEPNKEWFVSEEDAEDFIKIIEECKQLVNK
uniref:KilA-N domain-containing protein n=1 Tax=viral metagenome TaxID=1070528 RepID=A0A6C0I706_9ZZZZ